MCEAGSREPEVHGDGHDDRHRYAVQQRGRVHPLFHRLDRGGVQEGDPAQDLDVPHAVGDEVLKATVDCQKRFGTGMADGRVLFLFGPKGLAEGKVEIKQRGDGSREFMSLDEAIARFTQ